MRVKLPTHETEKYIFQVLAHVVLAVLIFLFEPFSRVYFLVVMSYFILRIILLPKEKKTVEILLGCAYFSGAEILFRMTGGGISYEASKYLVILFVLMGMFYKGISGKGWPYFMYLILLVPSVLIASMTLTIDANFRTNIAFVLSGPVCLGIAALFCYDRKIRYKEVIQIINYIALPCISTTVYLFLYSPSIEDVLSGTASNFAASGGFGPNQVATILGLGMFAIVVRIFLKSSNLLLKIFNFLILAAMTYRAIVTFSRGGVLAAVIVIIAFLVILFFKAPSRKKNEMAMSFLLFSVAIIVTWILSVNETHGLIENRYTNKDSLGREKQDVTTGRVDLFMEELEGFVSNPFVGIGASRVKDKRVEAGVGHLPSHNEVGRLLSEHGLFGVIALTILLFKPLAFRTTNKQNIFFYAFLAFWFATINHSGMRIAAPSFLYALSLLNITYEKSPLHRKQLKS